MKIEKIELVSDKVLTILWDDGHESLYFADHLRENCPCADCDALRANKQENSPFKILSVRPEDIRFVSYEIIGRYAVSFKFSDGHSTGIYTYEQLRDLCQCDFCTGKVVRIQGPLH